MRDVSRYECARRRTGAVLLVAWLLAASSGRAVEVGAAGRGDPQRLIFLLEYVGSDYDMAVQDGNVVNAFEYDEIRGFTKELIRAYQARGDRSKAVVAGLAEVKKLIVRRAPGDEVWSATRSLLPVLTSALGRVARPTTPPNVANGRRLFVNDCAPCHGSPGGDAAPPPGMDPPPTVFRSEVLEQLSPRHVYSAVSLGIDGTAMPSFAAAYSERQRWDVAFFVMTLRADFVPARPPEGLRLSFEELAVLSNRELQSKLGEGRLEAPPGEVEYLRENVGVDAGGAGGLAAALQLQDAFGGVAERVMPRVVGVASYVSDPSWTPAKLQASRGEGWLMSNGDQLRYPGFRPVRSGSGFIVDDMGSILTCNHLVRDDRGQLLPVVDVELVDQRHLPYRIVGTEPTLDLALLRAAEAPRMPDGAPPLEFGDSDRMQVGHWVIALGDPPGAEKALTVGLVSSPAQRQCYQEQITATRLQTSLVVPASGLCGPVVDIQGHVVGMTVRQEASGAPGGVVTDGPAAAHTLPINLVLTLYEALAKAQSNQSPWIGVSVLELPLLRRRLGAQAESMAIPQTGVYIDDVFDPSPASRGGVRPGDFLVTMSGHPILSVADFQTWLYVLGIGGRADLELVRNGKPVRLGMPIEVRPPSATTR
jgi:serine protease Do